MSNPDVKNVAHSVPATVFDIFPTKGDPIKLMGWLRTYADYPVSSDLSLRDKERGDFEQRKIAYTDVIQEIYEVQGTGEWLGVETWKSRNVANISDYRCRIKLTKDKHDLVYFFRSPDYTRQLLAAVGVEYATYLGTEEA
ncbi:hypothetical protein TUM4438_10380 [Shewanella sairae]|uniref:Uncharacterized protein n=1 Tax=Shewanella sairae TaxID=190310 RepID=A0ABQ4P5W7_9GAMM|nr:hypothetical protein [Shewanella sairae]MCL1130472.1 hypothetical protein [Shewanella sairae]GIU42854.1 hypothetical protein TUM4438_10380 [Shewanella sairae]